MNLNSYEKILIPDVEVTVDTCVDVEVSLDDVMEAMDDDRFSHMAKMLGEAALSQKNVRNICDVIRRAIWTEDEITLIQEALGEALVINRNKTHVP